MNFGQALEALKTGDKVARRGWNGKNMWLLFFPGFTQAYPATGSPYNYTILREVNINPHIDMMTATGEIQPGWLASQTDMLADDWEII